MKKRSILWLAALVLVAAGSLYIFINSENNGVQTTPLTEDTVPVRQAEVEPAPNQIQTTTNQTAANQTPESSMDGYAGKEPAAGNETSRDYGEESGQTITDTVLSDRTIGNPEAPVTVTEFASLTCSHCASFYTETFPELREKYIETGQVYFVYKDFPLNAPALEATIIARCLPEDKFFPFIKFLYSTQNDWAYEANYSNYLKQNAKLLGLSEERYTACVNNEDLQQKFSANLSELQSQYELRSTPTFIVSKTGSSDVAGKIVGSQPLKAFETELLPLLDQSETKDSATDNE